MMTVDINYADREIDILKNNGDRDLNMMTVVWKRFWHYFRGITATCLKMVSGLQANDVDKNPHFRILENYFQILKILFFNIRKLISILKLIFDITKHFLI